MRRERDERWTRSESVEEFNKPGLASIFDPAITDDGVDGCQLNLSVTRPAQTPTILISILAVQHVDLRVDESNLYANHFNLDDFVTLIRLTNSIATKSRGYTVTVHAYFIALPGCMSQLWYKVIMLLIICLGTGDEFVFRKKSFTCDIATWREQAFL